MKSLLSRMFAVLTMNHPDYFKWGGFLVFQVVALLITIIWYASNLAEAAHTSLWHDILEDIMISGITSIVVGGLFWLPISSLLVSLQRRNFDLSDLKEVAETANEAKAVFLAACSHHLRTPINIISGFANLIDKGLVKDKEAQKEYVSLIIDGCDHLEAIVDKILLFVELDSKNSSRNSEKRLLKIEQQIFQAIEYIKSKSSLRGIEISAEVCATAEEWIDEKILRIFLEEIIENSLVHSNADKITIAFKRRPDTFVISVADDGIGIPEEVRSSLLNVFNIDSFDRYHAGTSRLGLGLPIVSRALSSIGASLQVKHMPDKGTIISACFKREACQSIDMLPS